MKFPKTLGKLAVERDEIEQIMHQQFSSMLPNGTHSPYLIVIPAFNEEESLAYVASKLPEEINGHRPMIVVINDGSTDKTEAIANQLGLNVITSPINRGQGASLRTGYLEAISADFEVVAIVDADGQWDPRDLEAVMKPIITGNATISQGSRSLGETRVGDRFRDFGVVFFAKLIRLLTKTMVTDTSSGIRAMSVEMLKELRLNQPQYQSSELLISALISGGKLAEVPVVMEPRFGGVTKKGKNLRYAFSYSAVVLKTALREHFITSVLAHTKTARTQPEHV